MWRILHKLGLGRLPASQRYKRTQTRWKRYEKQRPGHQLQVDVKFIEPLGQKCKRKRWYQYTAIDDCTRIRVLRAYERNDQKTAIQFIDHVKIRPRTPRLNGKVERSHRIDSDEFYKLLKGEVLDDTRLFAERLQQWEDHYNYDRPHGALGGQTPYERLKQKAAAPLS
ncbi:integrase core domain-containing protein [Microbacterium paulum]